MKFDNKLKVNETLFPKRLKSLRLGKDLSIAEAEKLVGVGTNTWLQWEKGTRIPNMITVVGIASIFKVNPAYLSGNDDNEKLNTLLIAFPELSIDDKKIVEKYSALTHVEKVFVGRVIDFILSHREWS